MLRISYNFSFFDIPSKTTKLAQKLQCSKCNGLRWNIKWHLNYRKFEIQLIYTFNNMSIIFFYLFEIFKFIWKTIVKIVKFTLSVNPHLTKIYDLQELDFGDLHTEKKIEFHIAQRTYIQSLLYSWYKGPNMICKAVRQYNYQFFQHREGSNLKYKNTSV